jgi:hypothetical protein
MRSKRRIEETEDAAAKRQTGISAKAAVRTRSSQGSRPASGVQDFKGHRTHHDSTLDDLHHIAGRLRFRQSVTDG